MNGWLCHLVVRPHAADLMTQDVAVQRPQSKAVELQSQLYLGPCFERKTVAEAANFMRNLGVFDDLNVLTVEVHDVMCRGIVKHPQLYRFSHASCEQRAKAVVRDVVKKPLIVVFD